MFRALLTLLAGDPGDALISRSTIIILSAVLLGMGAGHTVGDDTAVLCGFAGLLGLASYCALALVAYWRDSERNNEVQDRVTKRLVRHRRTSPWSAPDRTQVPGSSTPEPR